MTTPSTFIPSILAMLACQAPLFHTTVEMVPTPLPCGDPLVGVEDDCVRSSLSGFWHTSWQLIVLTLVNANTGLPHIKFQP